ncbi:serine/threonine protein kinase [bacterium]|nr:serine/threonine protein kinase [bacterium]
MPAPSSVPELLDRVRRSGLVPPDRLDGFVAGLQASGQAPATTAVLLDLMVEAGMVTRFHADKLAAGKYKGFQIGSYLILDQLGTGGMGQVYLAEHAAMRRLVALKVLPVFASEDAVARERFLREARAAATLDHPNVVRVFDLCQEGRLLYLVMEYVEGISLQALVARNGPLAVEAACHYARQVLYGLQHAHDLGFVHRDIKPANLLLDRAGVVKILDLGLVRSQADAAAGLTRKLDNRAILGTADYVAPEQAVDSSSVDIRADLYSLGATLYFMLTGRPLFPDGRTAQKLVWQQIKDPVPVTRFRPDVPPGLADVVHVLLQKRKEDRFQSPAEAFEALAPWDDVEVSPPPEEWLPQQPARVQAARAAAQTGGTARAGSTSQILTLAMRSESGVSRRIRASGGDPSSEASAIGSGSAIRRRANPTAETDAVCSDDTTRTPHNPRRPRPAEPERKRVPLLVLVAVCAAAAAAATAAVLVAMR